MKSSLSRSDLWRDAFRQRPVWMRAFKLGFTTGCVQAAVNQGDVWLHHAANAEVLVKTIASPLIGFTLVLVAAAETWVQKSSEQK